MKNLFFIYKPVNAYFDNQILPCVRAKNTDSIYLFQFLHNNEREALTAEQLKFDPLISKIMYGYHSSRWTLCEIISRNISKE